MRRAFGTACLLLHGLGGTPFEVAPLAPPLRALGCTVEIPLYPGHGTSPEDFQTTFFPDWLAHAEERFLALAATHARVIPIGFSMGGSIALTLAAKYPDLPQLAGVVALTPPYSIRYRQLLLRRLTARLRGLWKKAMARQSAQAEQPVQASARPTSRELAPHEGYEDAFHPPQLLSLGKGLRAMRTLLPALSCPLFMMAEVDDWICPPEAGLTIARTVASRDVSLRWVRMLEHVTHHHMLTTHRDTRELVARSVAAFVEGLLRDATA